MTETVHAGIADDGTWAMPEGSGPCRTWPLDNTCLRISRRQRDALSEPDAQVAWRRAVEIATELLWRLTAGRFGLCRVTVRPEPMPRHARRRIGDCRCRPSGCRCGTPQAEIRLPGPVHHTPEHNVVVRLDGVLFDRWRLLDGNLLVRADGRSWPLHQDLGRDLDEPLTWGVTYWRGREVPPGGCRAVTTLALEIWKGCWGDSSCRLPQRVQSVQREGVEYTMLDPMDYLAEGRTGVPEVDTWVLSVNPGHHRQPGGIYSVDMPRFHVTDQA